MALLQANQVVKDKSPLPIVYARHSLIFTTKFKLASLNNAQPNANDIVELMPLPAEWQVKSVAVNASAALSGTYRVAILSGTPGADHTANASRIADKTDLTGDLTGATNSATDTFEKKRDEDNQGKTVVGFLCTVDAAANETAEVTVAIEYYQEQLQG